MGDERLGRMDILAALGTWHRTTTRRSFLRRLGVTGATSTLVLSASQLLGACAPAPTTAPVPPTGSPTVKRGGHVVEANNDLNTLLPGSGALLVEWLVQSFMFDPLVAVSPAGDLQPLLAQGLATFSADGLTATFKLKPNVKWTDGQPVTAADVVFSYSMDIDPSYTDWSGSSTRGQITSYLDSVQAIDDYTVQFKAKQVDAQFALIGTRLTAPKHVLGSLSAADLNKADFITNPSVSFGPFKLDAWQKGSQVSLVANKDCYRGAPALDRYVVRTQPNNQNYATMLKTAEADQAQVPVSDYQSLQSQQSITITTVGQVFPDIILMNQDPTKSASQLFGDKAVRQALAYAIDKQAMLQSAYFGLGVVADSIVPPGTWAYSKAIQPQYTYDPARAESLLDDAGWKKGSGGIREKNGVPLQWEVIGYPQFATQAQILQKYWSAVGCNVSIKLGTVPETVDQLLQKRDFAMMLINVGPNVVFPDLRVYVHSKNSVPGGINGSLIKIPALDSLMDQTAGTLDRTKQQALFAQIQDLMAQEQPLIPMVVPNLFLGLSTRVQGTQLTLYSWDRSRPWINEEWVSDGK